MEWLDMRLMRGNRFLIKLPDCVSSLWVRMSFVIVCVLLVIFSLRSCADGFDEKDFTIGKEEQMRKARKLLCADSIDAAFVLLNMGWRCGCKEENQSFRG